MLAWADNRKDLEVVWKLLSQFCLAYRGDGGCTIVVLSRRKKLVRIRVDPCVIAFPLVPVECTHMSLHSPWCVS